MLLTILVLLLSLQVYPQSDTLPQKKEITFKLITGIKVYNPYNEDFGFVGDKPKGLFGYVAAIPVLGIEYKLPHAQFGFEYRRHTWIKLITKFPDFSVGKVVSTDMVIINYYIKRKNGKKNFCTGLGHTWFTKTHLAQQLSGYKSHYRGFTLYFGVPFKWLYVELRSEMMYYPFLEVRDRDLFALNFIYKIPLKRHEK